MNTVVATQDTFRVELTVRKGGTSVTYSLVPLPPTGRCRAWRLRKVGGEAREKPYIVRQDGDGAPLTCSCVGFASWNRCKHARSMAKLLGVDAGGEMKTGQEASTVTRHTTTEVPGGDERGSRVD